MQYKAYTNNHVELEGRISKVKEYSPGKAANVTIAVDNGKDAEGSDRPTSFVQTKCFAPATYGGLKVGMLVRLFGHIPRFLREGRRDQVHPGHRRRLHRVPGAQVRRGRPGGHQGRRGGVSPPRTPQNHISRTLSPSGQGSFFFFFQFPSENRMPTPCSTELLRKRGVAQR